MSTETKVASPENPELPEVSSFIPVVVQNTILPVLSFVKNSIPQCFLSLPSTFLKNI